MRQDYALRVDGDEVSMMDFSNRIRNERLRLRSMFGPAYNSLAEQLEANLQAEMVDRLVAESLLQRAAYNVGLRGGERQLASFVSEQLGGLDPERYRNFLAQIGQTAVEFESNLAHDLAVNSFAQIINDMSIPSKEEALSLWREENIRFDLEFVRIPTTKFAEDVVIEETEVQDFFDSRIADYEIPARISYSFAPIPASLFDGQFEIFEEDIELFYQDNSQDYRIPEERHIVLITAESSLKEDALKQLEKEIEGLTNSGGLTIESLTATVGDQASIDDRGWITKGVLPAELERTAFQSGDTPSVSLTGNPGATRVFVVTLDSKPESQRPLGEVRGDIEKQIRTREAPAFAAAFAADLLEEWRTSKKTLADFVLEKSLALQSPERSFAREENPIAFEGLTESIFARNREKQLVTSLNGSWLLVEIHSFENPYFPELANVREQVENDLREQKLSSATRGFVEELQSLEKEEVRKRLADKELSLESIANVSRESNEEILAIQEVRSRVLQALPKTGFLDAPIAVDDGYLLVGIESVRFPTEQPSESELKELMQLAHQQTAQEAEKAVIEKLKQRASIEVNPSALN
jgi:peptidyl-prolyl cis-trans isomerase D